MSHFWLVVQQSRWSHWIAWPHKHGDCRGNFVSISSSSWDLGVWYTFSYTDSCWSDVFFEFVASKGVKINSPKVHGSDFEKSARKKSGVQKYKGSGNNNCPSAFQGLSMLSIKRTQIEKNDLANMVTSADKNPSTCWIYCSNWCTVCTSFY